ncbi:DHHC palmitoyltransferase-domain-containing protein [Chytridium lagenaria]|nr:DHHC palmitoyltransferase-domain-containing protein [Chytridium lagenaria]
MLNRNPHRIPFLTARSSIIIPILFGYLLVNTLVQLFKTTLTDPGYLPIDLHLDPTYTGPASAIEAYERHHAPTRPSADPKPSADFGSNLEGQPFPSYDQPTTTVDESPLPRGYPFLDASFGNAAGSQQPINVVRPVLPGIGKIEINGVEVKIKTSHCSTCDRCVEVHDHHCPWTANCIGKRNYRHFFAFLFFCTLLDLFVWSSTLAHIVLIADEKSRLYSALWSDTVAAQPLLVVIQIKRRYYYDDPDVPASGPRLRRHPFHKGSILSNVSWVICRPIESSHLSDYMPLPTSPSTTTAPPPQIVYEILEESTDAVTLHVEEERAEIKPGKFIKSQ